MPPGIICFEVMQGATCCRMLALHRERLKLRQASFAACRRHPECNAWRWCGKEESCAKPETRSAREGCCQLRVEALLPHGFFSASPSENFTAGAATYGFESRTGILIICSAGSSGQGSLLIRQEACTVNFALMASSGSILIESHNRKKRSHFCS